MLPFDFDGFHVWRNRVMEIVFVRRLIGFAVNEFHEILNKLRFDERTGPFHFYDFHFCR